MLVSVATCRRGGTSVEFALVAFPFLLVLLALIEVGLLLAASASLDMAVAQAARQIRTGQTIVGGDGYGTAFAAAVCDNIVWLRSGCPEALRVETTILPQSDPGVRDIVQARAAYRWQPISPAMFGALGTGPDGRFEIFSTTAFRAEAAL